MKNVITALLVTPLLAGCASILDKPTRMTASDLDNFTALMDRSFYTAPDNTDSVLTDHRVRITSASFEGTWLYIQLNKDEDLKLYRQRISHLSISPDKKIIIQRAYDPVDRTKFTDAWTNPLLLENLTTDEIQPFFDQGCDQHWTKQDDGSWYGHVSPETCKIFSSRRNADIHIESEGWVSADKFGTAERGFDTDGKFLWGTAPGERLTLYPASQPQE